MKYLFKKAIIFLNKNENICSSLLFLLITIVFFFPVVFQGKTLTTSILCGGVTRNGPYEYDGQRPPIFPARDPGAFAWVDEPLSEYVGEKIKENWKIPIWNPNMGLGYPILGGIQEGVLFPLNYIVFLFSSQLAWDILMLVRVFLAGFVSYLFARKIGLRKIPSFLAGTIFMFGGYMLEYINMAHLSTEVLIPLVLLAAENFLIKKNIKNLIFYILAIVLTILPGMPEATFFAVLLGGFWFLFSFLFIHGKNLKKEWGKALGLFVFANLTALLTSAIQLIPFVEFLKESFNSHAGTGVGLGHIPFDTFSSIFSPFLFNPFLGGVNYFPYFGVAASLLAGIAILSIKNFNGTERRIVLFFSFFALIGLAKIFGFPLVNWIGALPIFETLIYPKYGVPAIAFSFSILSAYGLSILSRKEISYPNFKIFALFLIFIASFVYTVYENTVQIVDANGAINGLTNYYIDYFEFDEPKIFFENGIESGGFLLAIFLFIIVLFLGFWVLIANILRGGKKWPIFIVFFVFCDLWFYSKLFIRADRYDTFKKAPFVEFLETEKNKDWPHRIYGQTAYLYPNTSSVFGLQDIRILMALVDERYFEFLENVAGVSAEELNTVRFTGENPIDLENRALDLLNVKYFIKDATSNDVFAEKIFASGQKTNEKNISLSQSLLNKKPLSGLLLHAPSKLEFNLPIDEKSNNIFFEYGIADSGAKKSNGVLFTVRYDCGGGEREIVSDLVNPVAEKKYRDWQKASLDLSSCLNKEAKIIFESKDNGNNAFDHFFVGNFLFNERNLVYDKEVQIVKNEDYIPRVFVADKARVLSDKKEIFKMLNDPNFDIRREVILEGSLPTRYLTKKESGSASDDSNATIKSYEAEKVTIDVSMKNDGFLVLLDQYYPGWKAFVDGKETEIYPTDYVFRSIYLTKGNHKVEFIYDPISYKAGKYITIVTILFLLALYVFRKKIDNKLFSKEKEKRA